MDASQTNGQNGIPQDPIAAGPTVGTFATVASYTGSGGSQWPINRQLLRRFFSLAGGSILYCISAVLVAYGVAHVLAPVLAESNTLRAAMPGVGTLWVYELALLAVLLLIVARKVVDDAVSVVIIIALYLIAAAVALGTVADRNPSAAVLLCAAGPAMALGKLAAMRRFVRIPFTSLTILALTFLVAVNYYGPLIMSRLMTPDAAPEETRRACWFAIQLTMIAGPILILITMLKSPAKPWHDSHNAAFLRSPAMVCLFTAVMLAASAVHAWGIGYMYALPEYLGDYLPVIAVVCLLLLEILPRLGLVFGPLHVIIASAPLAVLAVAIWRMSIGAAAGWILDLVAYPPVFCTITGLAIGALAWRRRHSPLRGVVFMYLLAAILTCGYDPEQAHDLNTRIAGAVLAAVLMVYGIESWRPQYSLLATAILTLGAATTPAYLNAAAAWHLTHTGAVSAVAGCLMVGLAIVFGKSLDRHWRFLGAFCMALFAYDLIGPGTGLCYFAAVAFAFLLVAAVAAVLWFRARDFAAAAAVTLGAVLRLFFAFASWRYIAAGFLALALGLLVSLKKRRRK